MLKRTVLSFILLVMTAVSGYAQLVNYQKAAGVLGQADMASKLSGTSDNQLSGPNGVAIDPTSGKVFVVDRSNHRILRWNSAEAMVSNSKAEAVFGQTDFTGKTSGVTSSKFNTPLGIYIDNSGRMWVSDYANNRVLRFDNASSKTTGASADAVLGQPDFLTATSGTSADKLAGPCGLILDNKSNLWVSDFNNHRILRFSNAASKVNGGSADGVLGQPDFVTKTNGTAANKLASPNAVYCDREGRVWISDNGNNRYLRFDNAASKANGADADGVLGQPDFITKTAAATRSGSGSTRFIWGDNFGRIYCVQENYHRILVYENGASKANGAEADYVLGQPDFNSNTALAVPTASSFNTPRAIAIDNVNGNIWVADWTNNRVLRFELAKLFQLTNNMSASSVLGQADFISKAAGKTSSGLTAPNGVAVDPKTGKLFIADRSNHRILRFSSADAIKTGAAAEAVFGQADFTTVTSGLSQTKFNNPLGINIDKAGRLWVSDFTNNRVLRFDNASSRPSGAAADGVLGQPDFTTSSAAASQSKLSGPCGLHADDAGSLWVSEFNSHRVTRWDSAAAKANGAPADGVLGQPDFTTSTSGLTAAKMANPNGLYVDFDGRLWVSDYGNKRYLRFDGAALKANGSDANGVLGQPNFTSNTASTTKSGTGTTRFIWGDAEGRIYTVQEDNNRILVYENGAYKANGADADYVIGQADFVSKTGPIPPTPSSLLVPRAIAIDNQNGCMWVADYSNNRVLRFELKGSTAAKFISVKTPNGGEDWGKGTKQDITWISGNITTVKLEYSSDNGKTWNLIATDAAMKNKYEWTLPAISTDSAKVRITDNDDPAISDVSDRIFRIGDVIYSVKVVSPNGYQQWEAGSTKNILFESKGASKVKLEYSADNGTTWKIIADSAAASAGSYAWKLPAAASSQTLLKVTGVENSVSDMSDKPFSITAAAANPQDFIFFADSPTKDIYDASWGFAAAPSTLTTITEKAPVTAQYSLTGNYSVKLNWKSAAGGDWGLAIAGPGWVGRDAMQKDTLLVSIFSETDMTSAQMPNIYLEDITNKKGTKTSLSTFTSSIKAGQWNKVIIPLEWFKTNSTTIDLTRVKTIFFGQNQADDAAHTLFLDNIRMTGGKQISGENQTVVVVIGSSTSAGAGASSYDSSWVGRYKKYMLAKDPKSYLVNLAVGGYTTYDLMPSDYTAPSGKPAPKVNNNITMALTYRPTAIIMNLPSNDANMGYTVAEQMSNFRTITKLADAQKVRIWVTTTQPRNFSGADQRNNLIQIKDSIIAQYKDKALDIFTLLANTDGTISPAYNSGDGVHLNDAGHKVIFDKVVDAKVWETITDVEEKIQVPSEFALSQNFPNPFNPSTTVEFALPQQSRVEMRIYNALGQEVVSLASGTYPAGIHRTTWDASRLASGMYLCRIMAAGENNSQYVKTVKMMLTK